MSGFAIADVEVNLDVLNEAPASASSPSTSGSYPTSTYSSSEQGRILKPRFPRSTSDSTYKPYYTPKYTGYTGRHYYSPLYNTPYSDSNLHSSAKTTGGAAKTTTSDTTHYLSPYGSKSGGSYFSRRTNASSAPKTITSAKVTPVDEEPIEEIESPTAPAAPSTDTTTTATTEPVTAEPAAPQKAQDITAMPKPTSAAIPAKATTPSTVQNLSATGNEQNTKDAQKTLDSLLSISPQEMEADVITEPVATSNKAAQNVTDLTERTTSKPKANALQPKNSVQALPEQPLTAQKPQKTPPLLPQAVIGKKQAVAPTPTPTPAPVQSITETNPYAKQAILSAGKSKAVQKAAEPAQITAPVATTTAPAKTEAVKETPPDDSELKQVPQQQTTQVAPATPAASADEGSPVATLTFAENSSDISDDNKKALDQLITMLKETPDQRIQIKAFAGSKGGTESDARRLALSRGLNVRAYIKEMGIQPIRLDIRALGSGTTKQPYDRVDIVLID